MHAPTARPKYYFISGRKMFSEWVEVGMWCCYVVGRPPAKFHRIRSSFDAPTDNYSGIIVGQTSDVFGLRKLLLGFPSLSSLDRLHSPLPTARPNLTSLVSPRPSSRARLKVVLDPSRAVVTVGFRSSPNIYKTSLFLFLDSLPIFLLSAVCFRSDRPN